MLLPIHRILSRFLSSREKRRVIVSLDERNESVTIHLYKQLSFIFYSGYKIRRHCLLQIPCITLVQVPYVNGSTQSAASKGLTADLGLH